LKAVFDEAIKVVLKNKSGASKDKNKKKDKQKKRFCNIFWVKFIVNVNILLTQFNLN